VTRTTTGRWCLRFVRRDNDIECLDRQACLIGEVLCMEPECVGNLGIESCREPRPVSERVSVACRCAVIHANRQLPLGTWR
jgi:hypothetical protein